MNDVWMELAAWVEAVGTIAAVVGAAWIAARESRWARLREEAVRAEASERERRSRDATKTAALNLAILAATQIHDLHLLLRDEVRRGRVTRVSPSRTLVSSERLLTTFPIQSLPEAEAMVAFSRFPGALATAAEIYANLESEVRAAPEVERSQVFATYAKQMARLDRASQKRLVEFRRALGFEAAAAVEPATDDAKAGA